MPIFPIPPGLTARLNAIPPPYKTAAADPPPPLSITRPESIPLPLSPSPSPYPAPTAPSTSHPTSTSTAQTPPPPPPEYSPSVYSQNRLSHQHLSTNATELGFPSSPVRHSAKKHAGHFMESRSDLSMRVDLEAGTGGGGAAKGKGAFKLYPVATERDFERLYWKRAVVGLGIALVVVIVVVVAVGVSLKARG